jgi:7,8-dihydroneopterin aldolase/epimerase/oxygenase
LVIIGGCYKLKFVPIDNQQATKNKSPLKQANSFIFARGLMDSIEVTGIKAYGYTGYLLEEKVLGQWFEVDLTMWLELATAGKSDDIQDTLDYREAIALTKETIVNAKFTLVERLAETIASQILQLKYVDKVRVQLSKPAAPIPDFGGRIKIDITRS